MLKDLLDDLEFISSIPKNAKPNFSDKTFTYTNEWFSTFKRRYKSERGEKGMVYVSKLIVDISNCYKTLDIYELRILSGKMKNMHDGLNNIVSTYRIDNQEEVAKNYEKSVKEIQELIEDIDSLIRVKNNFFNHQPIVKCFNFSDYT